MLCDAAKAPQRCANPRLGWPAWCLGWQQGHLGPAQALRRVMLYDPDWNPSTDMQARERAWRVGQVRCLVCTARSSAVCGSASTDPSEWQPPCAGHVSVRVMGHGE